MNSSVENRWKGRLKVLRNALFIVFTSTVEASMLVINSTPAESNILVRSLKDTDNWIKIGKTPLKMKFSNIVNSFSKSPVFVIKLEKNGYYSQNYVFSDTSSVDVDLEVNLEASNDALRIREIDDMIARLFESQHAIRASSYDEALESLREQQNLFPNLSIIPELKGAVQYLKKDLNAALAEFRLAVSLNPYNVDALRKKQSVENLLGVSRKPGQQGAGAPSD